MSSRLSVVEAVPDDSRRHSMTATICSCYHDAPEFPTAPAEEDDDDSDSRRDSGYESVPSSAQSGSRRREPCRRTSTASMTATAGREKETEPRRGRPLTRTHKSTASVPSASITATTHSAYPHSRLHRKTSSLYRPSSSYQYPPQTQPSTFYYFHAPEPPSASTTTTSASSSSSASTASTSLSSFDFDHSRRPSHLSHISSYHNHPRRPSQCHGDLGLAPLPQEEQPDTPVPPPPPTTTCYWTSNHTRRLEYAAIDAASRGVKGWVRRNLVPDCLVPLGAKKHVAFDDDSGSVRRYRLDLDDKDDGPDSEYGSDDDARVLDEFGDDAVDAVQQQAREKPKSKKHHNKKKGNKKGPWAIFPFGKARQC